MEHLKRPCIQHQRRERQRRHFFWSKKQPLPDPEPVKMFIERAVVEVSFAERCDARGFLASQLFSPDALHLRFRSLRT